MSARQPLLTFTDRGIYCPPADVFIDPWKPVERALITHAHADHSRPGHHHYLAHRTSVPIMEHRLGSLNIQAVDYQEPVRINGVRFSFHPAGHIPGSAQIRVEHRGEVWVASGDYKLDDDGLSTAFEPLACHTFITECTFGLPVFRWETQEQVFASINQWWRSNRERGICSVLVGYSLGKAQRILRHVDPSIGPIFLHGAIENMNRAVAASGVVLPATQLVTPEVPKATYRGALVVAPPSALGSTWLKRFGPYSTAIASGWMQLRGARRRRAADRGFVLSDHADWPGLNKAIAATGAEHIIVTHGYTTIFGRWLEEQGYQVSAVSTRFEGERIEGNESTETDQPDPS